MTSQTRTQTITVTYHQISQKGKVIRQLNFFKNYPEREAGRLVPDLFAF